MTPLSSTLQNLGRRLIEPSPALHTSEQRERAQLLAAFTLVLLFITSMLLLLFFNDFVPASQLSTMVAFVLLIAIYAFSRSRYYFVAAVAVVGLLLLSPVLNVFSAARQVENPSDLSYTLIWMIFGVLMSNLLFSARVARLTAAMCILLMLALPLVLTGITLGTILIPASFVLATMVFSALVRRYDLRRYIEQARTLSQREADLRRITDHMQDVVAYADAQGVMRYVSPSYLRLFGRSPEGAIGISMGVSEAKPVVHPQDRQPINDAIAKALAEQTTVTVTYRHRHHERGYIWLEMIISYVPAENGIDGGIVFTSRDITERKLAEAAEHQQRLLAEALRDSAAALNRTLELDEVLDQILEQVARVLPGYDSITLMLIEGGFARIVRYKGHYESVGMSDSIWTVRFNVAETWNLQRMVETFEPCIIQDTHTEAFWRTDLPEADWIHSYLGAPITIEGQVIGFLNLDSATPNTFDPAQARPLQAFADQAGIAIRNARLYDDTRRARELAEALRDSAAALNRTLELDEVLDRILEQVSRVILPSDAINLMLIENGIARVARYRGYYDEHGYGDFMANVRMPVNEIANFRNMVATGTPSYIADAHNDPDWTFFPELAWIRSDLGAPIRTQGEIIGFLMLDSTQVNVFTSDHAERLQAFADQAGIAIRNARLFDDIRRERELAEALRDSAAALNSTLELDKVLERILEQVSRVISPSDAANLLLIEDGIARVARYTAYYDAHGMSEFMPTLRMRVADVENFQYMVETGKSVIISDTQAHPGWSQIPQLSWICSNIGAPIHVEGEVIGFLMLDSTRVGAFTPDHAERLQAFADQAGIALRNARLYDATRRERELADTLRDIGLTVNSTLEQGELFSTILQQIARVFPYDAAAMWVDHGDGMYRPIFSVGYERFGVQEKLLNLAWPRNSITTAVNEETTIISRVSERSTWIVTEGFEWVQSWAVAPIIVRGEIIGRLTFDHTEAGFYGPQHQPILDALAAMISIAIGNSRLYEAERRQRREIEAVQQSSISLTASLELPQVLDAILSAVRGLFPIRSAHIFLYDEAGLTFGAAMIDHERVTKPYSEPRQDGLTYTVARSGEMITVSDMTNHPLTLDVWKGERGAIVGIPLKIGAVVVGVMNVSFSTPRKFEDAELLMLNLLAAQASIAIENAHLYDETRRYADELEERVESRTAELDLQRQEMQTILDATGEGIFYTENNIIQYVNAALCAITGYTPNELIGQHSRILRGPTLTSEETAQLNSVFEAVRHGEVFRTTTRGRRKDNHEYDAGLTVSIVGDDDDSRARMVTVIRDISKEKELERQKANFIANASHELRTPITNLKTRLYLTRMRPQNLETHLDIMETVAERLQTLVEDLLDVSRFERGVVPLERRPVVLQGLVDDVVKLQRPEAENKRINLICNLPSMPLYIDADPKRFVQVITNLVTNAINYTPEGGQVLVLVAGETVESGERRAVVHVQDTGMGIAPENLTQIFQPFFRVSGEMVGTGLGLSIAREIIALHEGEITVESQVGRGSRFSIRLALVNNPIIEVQ